MANYLWPLNGSTTPDEMNTSFGPRINEDRWDFHDGIDLPAPHGTPVHAMRKEGHHAGPGGTGGFSSRHVVVKVKDPTHGRSLQRLPASRQHRRRRRDGRQRRPRADDRHRRARRRDVSPPAHRVPQGDAQADRQRPPAGLSCPTPTQRTSPRRSSDRFNRLDAFMAARLLFGRSSKLEGDLRRVEVDLRRGTRLLTTRVVDFDDKSTIIEGKGDAFASSTTSASRATRSRTWSSTAGRISPTASSSAESRPVRRTGRAGHRRAGATSRRAKLDRGPGSSGGRRIRRFRGRPTAAGRVGHGHQRRAEAGPASRSTPPPPTRGTRGLRCVDDRSTEASTQRAGIEYTLPPGRFEWRAEGWFNPTQLTAGPRSGGLSPVFPQRREPQRGGAHPQRSTVSFGPGSWQRGRTTRYGPVMAAAIIAVGQLAQVATGAAPGRRRGRRPPSCHLDEGGRMRSRPG